MSNKTDKDGTHTHACTRCGNVWKHDGTGDFDAGHTCRCGKLCTMKYTPDVAAGIAATCKAGGDAIAYVKAHDPMATLSASIFGGEL